MMDNRAQDPYFQAIPAPELILILKSILLFLIYLTFNSTSNSGSEGLNHKARFRIPTCCTDWK